MFCFPSFGVGFGGFGHFSKTPIFVDVSTEQPRKREIRVARLPRLKSDPRIPPGVMRAGPAGRGHVRPDLGGPPIRPSVYSPRRETWGRSKIDGMATPLLRYSLTVGADRTSITPLFAGPNFGGGTPSWPMGILRSRRARVGWVAPRADRPISAVGIFGNI